MKCSLAMISGCLFLFVFFFHFSMGSLNLIQHACKKATESDPKLSYNFCITSLWADPRSQTSSLRGLGVISFELAMSNATRIRSHIVTLLEDKRFDAFARACLKDCYDLYMDAIPTLKRAVSDFKSKHYVKANLEASSAMDASVTCEEGFKEKKGEVSPLMKENNDFFQVTAIALAFTKMIIE